MSLCAEFVCKLCFCSTVMVCTRICEGTVSLRLRARVISEGLLPTYHYRCKECGYDFSKYQSFSDEPVTLCPQCGKKSVRKVYSAPPINFKGKGFYRTDK